MNDYQRIRLKEFCEFYKWPEDQTAQLFECSKAFFECVWLGMDPKSRDEEMAYYNGPWLTLRQMSYSEVDSFPDEAKALIDNMKPGQNLLEFGCGVGDGLIYAAKKGINVYGVEVAGKIPFLNFRRKYHGCHYTLAESLCRFKGIIFQGALLISSLDHVPDPISLAMEISIMTQGPIYATPCIDETYDRPTHNKEILKHVPEAFKIIDEHNKRTQKIS